MKNPSKNPFHQPTAEEPIIRPLEQRRVPSATGAAFALPLPPEEADVLPIDEVPAHFEGELSVEGEVLDELFDERFAVDPLPINFDDVIDGIGAGEGEYVMDEGTIEEFNPDVIFYTLFAGGVDENGEPLPFDGEILGCGGIGDGLPLEGEILGDGEVIEEVSAFLDKDGDGLDDVTGESYQPPVYWTLDMVKRGGGETTTTGAGDGEGEEINPEIYYSTAGGPAPTAGGAPDATPEPTAGDHSHDPAPAHHAAADQAPEFVGTEAGSVEVPFEVENAAQFVALPAGGGHELVHFDEVNVPATPAPDFGAISHDFTAHELPIAPVAFGSDSVDPLSSGLEAHTGDFTVDAWVPAVSAGAELLAHLDGLTAEAQPEHAEVIAPVDAGATAIHGDTMRGSAAMAATGALLLSRDAKKREDKEQA